MNQEQAFLQAVAEAPDDDAPRLVYADWLTDHGDAALGEFIRLQCRMARLPPGLEQDAMWRRQHELLGENEERWLGPLLPVKRKNGQFTFQRGFVEGAHLQPYHLLHHTADLLAGAPLLRELSLYAEEGELRWLRANPVLARLESLSFSSHGWGARPTWEPVGLARWPRLPRLRRLSLRMGRFGDRSAVALAAAPLLENVEDLDLGHNLIGPAGALALARSPHLGRLRSLSLGGNPLGDAGACVLLRHGAFGRALEIDLSRTGIGDDTLRCLGDCRHLLQVEKLNLSHNALSADGVEALAGAAHLAGLRSLDLAHCPVGDGAARALARPDALPALEELWLNQSGLSDTGLLALVASPRLASLRLLDLAFNDGRTTDDNGRLPHDGVTDAGVAALERSPRAARLKALGLTFTNVGLQAMLALLRSPRLPALRDLGQFTGTDWDDPAALAEVNRELDARCSGRPDSGLHDYELT
jgi:uncharacterized protein (TIGR02996 family)